MINLNHKIIVVTGGNGLLGSHFVKACRDAGAVCINADISCSNNIENHQLNIDITNESSISFVIETVYQRFGRIDGWVNNAYPRTSDWSARPEDIQTESWRKNIDMHMTGYYLCCKHAINTMNRQENGGAIVNIASIYGIVAPDFMVYSGTSITSPIAYAAIKGGIIQLSRFLASYYGHQGIRVNCLSPGGIFDNQDRIFVDNYTRKVPARRMGSPNDLTGGLVYLLSDFAKYLTGHNLVIDGGWTAI
jgi:NAD(P)-dependent dehydrogenase (short-subunit alcohol dehydrogenase family)